MMHYIKKNILYASVFITGACILVVEIAATRILAPYFGNTVFTVSSVISIILAALSLGYYIGGVLADRYPSFRFFFLIILLSGLSIFLLQILVEMTLPLVGYAFSIKWGPLFASLSLFLLPGFLLGTLSPFAIVLQKEIDSEVGVGSISGRMFFWSTAGSIVGSLSAGFILIPFFGISTILIGVGGILCAMGLVALFILGFEKDILTKFMILSSIFFLGAGASVFASKERAIYKKDGVYERLTIYKGESEGREAYFFQQDRSNSGASFLDSDELVYEYTKYYSLYKIFNPNARNVLVIGGGAYSIPKRIAQEIPDARVDVSEIEPSLFTLAQTYFRLRDVSRIHNSTKDGRRFLRDSQGEYDMIFSDVYHSLFSLPSHFTTKEFFELAKSKLSKDGIFVANIIGTLSPEHPSFALSEMRTFREVFPQSYFFAVSSPKVNITQNIIFVGSLSEEAIDIKRISETYKDDPILGGLSDHMIHDDEIDFSKHPIFTDDYAPVDYFAASAFSRALLAKKIE